MTKKSPYKYATKTPTPFIIVGILAGILLSLFIHVLDYSDQSLNTPDLTTGTYIFLYVVIPIVLGFVGLLSWFQTRYYLTKINANPNNQVDPDKLTSGKTYWLNGEFRAKFLGKNTYTGTLLFWLEGVNNPEDETDYTELLPGEVRGYITLRKEA